MSLSITTNQVKLLRQPLDELFQRLDSPAALHKTLNRLFFDNLLKGGNFLPDELENLNALLDFLLACQVVYGATLIVAEA